MYCNDTNNLVSVFSSNLLLLSTRTIYFIDRYIVNWTVFSSDIEFRTGAMSYNSTPRLIRKFTMFCE